MVFLTPKIKDKTPLPLKRSLVLKIGIKVSET
jgi:hypothetical protein